MFLVYTSTHMLIMPLLAIVIFSFATRQYPWEASGWFWLYSFVGFFVVFNLEVSRKIRAPEEEIEGVDSYTKIFGTYGAAYLVLLIRVIDTARGPRRGPSAGQRGSTLHWLRDRGVHDRVPPVPLLDTPKTARRMETYAGVYIVAFDLILAIELGRTTDPFYRLHVMCSLLVHHGGELPTSKPERLLGGKAANLIQLRQVKQRAPPFYVVTADAFRLALRSTSVSPAH